MALTFPTLSLGRQQILTIAAAVVVVCAAAWFGWQYFEDKPPPPAAKPPPVAAAKQIGPAKAAAPAPEKLIADLLAASGLNRQLDQLPQQLIGGVRQSSKQRSRTSPAVLAAIEKAMAESFTAQNFRERLGADLKKNFDQKRVQALLGDLSAPAVKRMIEMEQASPTPDDLSRFASSQAARGLSPERTELLKRIDAATKASDLALETAFASMNAVALGIAGAQARKTDEVDKTIEKQRALATANIRNSTLVNLAFTYRNASDAELDGYAKFYETEHGKWFTGIVYASLLEEARSAATKAGERVSALAGKPDKLALAAAMPLRSKSRADARACLDFDTNPAIIKCAEPYR